MSSVNVTFGASIGALLDKIDEAKGAIEGIKESTDKVSEGFKKLAEIAGVSLSIEGFRRFVEDMADLGTRTERAMVQLGQSAEQIGALEGVAKLTGTSFEGLQTAMERSALNIQKSTKDAFNPAAQGLRVLGLNAKDLIGIPADQYFAKLADAVSKFAPSLNLTAAVQASFGRGAAQMLPLLIQGSQRFEEMRAAVLATGAALSDAQAHAFHESHETLTLLGLTVQGLGIAIFDRLRPAVDAITRQITGFVAEVRDSVKESGAWAVILDSLAFVAKSVATAIASIGVMIRFINVEVKALWDAMVAGGNDNANRVKTDLDKIVADYRKTLDDLWGAKPHVEVPVTSAKQAPALDMGGKSGLQAQLEYWKNAIKLQDDYYKKLKDGYEFDLQMGRITETQKTQLLLQALAARERTQLDDANNELKVGGLTVAQKQKIEDDKTQIAAGAALERQKIVEGEALYNMKAWGASLGGIQSAWDAQLKGLLARTTTFAQAMHDVASQLVLEMIKEFEKLAIIKPLEQMLSGVAPPAQFFKTILDMIMGAAGSIFAGVTAFFAPELGPAAPAAGAAAAGAVVAAAKGMASLDVGGYVLSDGLANIHAGETIVPASVQQPYSPAQQGSGLGVTFVVQTLDTNSFQSYFQKNGLQLARILQRHMDMNPSVQGA